MPSNVRDRSFLPALPSLCILSPRPSTMVVGINGGSPFNHSSVLLVCGSPNCQGWIICVASTPTIVRAYLCIVGFSTRTLGALAAKHSLKNIAASIKSWHRPGISPNHRTQFKHRYVHGGWAITKSHGSRSTGRTSPCMCRLQLGLGCSALSRSQLYASCPRSRNASCTVFDHSHATNTRIIGPVGLEPTTERL